MLITHTGTRAEVCMTRAHLNVSLAPSATIKGKQNAKYKPNIKQTL